MNIIGFILKYKYLAIFLSSIFEGPIVMAATGFLLKLGYFEIFAAYFALLFGDLVGDIFYYCIGYFGADRLLRKYGKFLSLNEEVVDKVRALFNKHDNKILFISKITMGFGFAIAILTTAGISKVPFKKFIYLNFLGGLIWTALMMTLGYFIGNFYLIISESMRIAFLIFIIIMMPLVMYGVNRYFRNEVLKNKI